VTLEDCRFQGNHGVGLWLVNSTADVSGCLFERNRSASTGGAIAMWGSDLTLTSSRLLRNGDIADPLTILGGGIYAYGGTVNATDCEIAENLSVDRGGGLLLDGGATAQLLRTTVAANRADTGGGVYAISGSATLDSCILWGNCGASSGSSAFLEAGASLTFHCSDADTAGIGGSGTWTMDAGSVSVDPEFCLPLLCSFVPNFTGSYRLEGTSPLIGLSCGLPGAPLTPCSSTGAGSITTSSWGKIKGRYR